MVLLLASTICWCGGGGGGGASISAALLRLLPLVVAVVASWNPVSAAALSELASGCSLRSVAGEGGDDGEYPAGGL